MRLFNGQASDDAWPFVIIMRPCTCNRTQIELLKNMFLKYNQHMCLRQEMTCIEKYHNILFKKMQQKPVEPGVYTAAVVQWL